MAEAKQSVRAIAFPDDRSNTGTVSAYTLVSAIGFNGARVFKRVRIGVEFGVSMETAKDMVRNVREANLDIPHGIMGRFIAEL